MYKIYGLFEPDTGKLRYVGYTSKSLDVRLKGHLRTKTNSYKRSWVLSLKKRHVKPVIKLIDYSDCYDTILKKEVYWIRYFNKKGCRLTNLTSGGEGVKGFSFTKEQKKMISEKTKDAMKNMSVEKKEKMKNSMKGRPAHNRRKIIDDLGNIYDCISDAGEASTIIQSIKNRRQSNGRSYKYYVDGDVKCDVYKKGKNKPVICVETGEIYPDVANAAESLGVSRDSVYRVCRGSKKTIKGLSLSYLGEL